MNVINYNKIQGEYLKDIENGAKEKFNKLYNYSYDIKAKSTATGKRLHSIIIYMVGDTIDDNGNIIKADIKLGEYINEIAIKLFAQKYSMESFLNKYNNYSYDNYTILVEEIRKLINEYKKYGFTFETSVFLSNSYRIYWNHENGQYYGNSSHYFDKMPISKAVMRSCIRDMKNKLEKQLNEITIKNLNVKQQI